MTLKTIPSSAEHTRLAGEISSFVKTAELLRLLLPLSQTISVQLTLDVSKS